MKKLARKVTRAAKVACQFKFTCTFEYIDLICVDGWKPENLQVVWLRGHRRIDSPTVKWVPKTENGNMVEGRATFDPPIAVSLLVTLYQGKDQQEYEQKEYKFYIENEGENGKKILASFNCNIADFAGVPSERHALDMTFKPISKKISRALLGLTMESEFLKKGKSSDDDMMSTFSRVSGHFEGDDAIGEEDEDNDPTTSTSSFQNIPMNTSISSEPSDSVASTMTNGFADESVVAATTATAAAAESNAPVGILKTSSEICTGNGPIEAIIPVEVTMDGEKLNLKVEDSVVVQTTNGIYSDTTPNGTAIVVKSEVKDTLDNANFPLCNNMSAPPINVEPVPPVTIEPVPSVMIEPVPPVAIEPVPPVTIESVPPTAVEPISPVTIEPIPPVTIEPVPPVMIEPVPPVTIEPVPPVAIEPISPVTIEPVPPVAIEPVPPVTIESVPPVTIKPVPPVTIEPVPPVAIEPISPVTIEPVPPVAIEPVPPVMIESVPPVTIKPVPPVTIEPVPPVAIEPISPVTIEPVPPVTVEPVPPVAIEPISPVTIEPVPPVTIEPVPPVAIEPVPPVMIEPVPPVTIESVPPTAVEPISPVMIEPVPPVTIESVPPTAVEPISPVMIEPVPPVTVNQEVQSKVGVIDQTNTVSSTNQDVTKSKKNKFSKNKNPPIEGETTPEATVVSKFVATPTMEGPCWLSDDIALINMDGQPVPKVTLDQTDLIGLYFSAEWCTPCKKFIPKLLKFYNYLIKEERSFQILYVSSDNTKDAMLGYMKEQNMPWLGLNFESPLGEQLRSDFKVSAIPLLCVVSRNGDIITDNTKKPVDAASSSEEEMTRLYNKWMHKLLEIKGLPVPDEVEPEKKKGLLSSLFGGKKKDKHQQQQQQPPQTDATAKNQDDVGETPPTSHKKSSKDTIAEQLLRQKEQLEHERVQERKVVQEKTQKLHVTLELNAQMQKDLNEKEEKIRILEAKNETYRQAADTKTDEIENLKQKVMMLEQELSSKADEEKKLLDEKRELLANISLHGWLCKRGIKGLTANTWRRRYFKIEEGCKLTYYKSAGDGPPQGFIDIDKIVSVKSVPVSQQDKTNCTFHIVTEGRTYELLAHDEATMNKWINSLQYMKEWRAKQKRES